MFTPQQSSDIRMAALRSRVSPIRIIEHLKEHRPHAGAEFEYLSEQARRARRIYDEQKPVVGFDLLAECSAHNYRALTVVTGSAGGFAVATAVPQTIADILRPWSILARAGVSFLTNLRSNVALPKLTGSVT